MPGFYRLDADQQRRRTFRRLQRYLRTVVAPYHPAFRDLCEQHSINVADIRSYEDFCQIPVTTKQQYRDQPLRYVLQPEFPGTEPAEKTSPIARSFLLKYLFQSLTGRPGLPTAPFIPQSLKEQISQRACREWLPVHFHASAGSTGAPTAAVYSHHDLTEIVPEIMAATLVRDTDPSLPPFHWTNQRLNLMPGAPHLAFFQAVFGKMMLGLSIFDTFGGKVIPTERQIQLFAQGRFNTLIAVPSYLMYWLRKAVALLDAGDIPAFGERFQTVALGAEPVSAAMKTQIRQLAQRLGAHPNFQIIETFGMTELKSAGMECGEGSGIHLNPRYYFWELLHPDTREPVAPGEPGVLVFSHIDWRGTVFVRYWTGDLIQGGMKHERCPQCGYTFVRIFGPIARADKDFTKIKGTLVALQELIAVVRDTEGVRNCQIVLDRQSSGADRFVVRALPLTGTNEQQIQDAIRRNVHSTMEVTPDDVQIETDEEGFEQELFQRTGIKAEYVVDRREADSPESGHAS